MNQPMANSHDRTVSVIIPAYNSSKFLPSAIESVLSQIYTKIEIVVVDDGSMDDTKMVCDRYPDVRYIYQHNQGVSIARNTGAQASQGRYLVFLDSDDRLLPQAVEIGVAAIESRPEVGLVFGRYLYQLVGADGADTTEQTFEGQPALADYASILADRHRIQCGCVLFDRVAFESVGGFDRDLWALEDINLLLRIAREFPVYFHGAIVSEYRIADGNVSSQSAKMLVGALAAHRLQWGYVEASGKPEYVAAYECGEGVWVKLFGDRIAYDAIQLAQGGDGVAAVELLRLVLEYDPELRFVDREVVGVATELLTVAQQQQIWGGERQIQSYPQTRCLHQLFEAQAARTPEAIAICYERQSLTYCQLNDRANQLAHRLQTLGVQPEVLVGIGLERSLELIIGILGILKAGGAYVPLDPTYPQERLEYMLGDAQVPVLVTSRDLAGTFGAYSGAIVCLEELEDAGDRSNPIVAGLTPDNLAYIIYTSGSTGRPKGVLVTHANVGRLFDATQEWYHFDDRDVWTMFHSYAFDFSVWELWGALIYGGRLVIVPVNVSRSPQEFYELLERERVTVLNQTPSAFRQLQRVASDPQAARLSLRLVIFGGEALDLHSLQPWFDRYGDETPQLVNMYGITETTVHVTYRPIGIADLQRGSAIGRPIPDLESYILDPDLQRVKIGVEGEMYVGGAGVARGYLNRPELTAERFIPHPFRASGDVLYKTGDLARYLPNGDIEYLGRIDNQVKIRGFRIELGEIESTLARQPQVQAAVVIVTEDEPGDLRLVAYLVPATETPIAIGDLRAKLREQLPDYMVPSSFVCVAAIPLTSNGKIDRQALVASNNSSPIVPPKSVRVGTSIVAILTTIWAEILRVESVGTEDNFFDLGGNSLLGLKVIDRIQSRFQLKVAVVRLYQYPTIRSMAVYLTEAMNGRSIAPTSEPIAAPTPATHTGIAVIGMVGRFPGADSVEQLWENLCAGRESITFFEKDEIDPSIDRSLLADPNYVRAKGVLAGAELFDAGFFGMGIKEAEVMDPQARIFVELAYEALEHAGYTATADNNIGVYAGSAENTYFERHLSGTEIIDRFGELQTHLVNDRDYLPTRASYKLNLKGPSISISTACSTSLVAIIQAVQGLLSQQCDLALAGGIAIGTPQNQGYLHQEGSIFTPDGHCRPFDAAAQGTSFNNGAGIVVLKRVDDAIAAGDRIYAVIKGVGINNDGADKVSFTAPSISGQMGAILQAQQMAGVDPATISYIEAHGTATALGDPIEVEALTQAFRTQTTATEFCGIGSIKSNLGHLTAAAGVAGFIKTVLAIYHRQIPPSINFDRPNPHIDFASSPFYVNTQLVDWELEPRRAGVSSFGGGGTNAHVILEQAPSSLAASPARPYQLLLLSGKTELAIDRLTTNLQHHLQHHPELDLADVAYTLQQGRKTYERRRFIVAKDNAQAIDYLATLPPHHTATRRAPSQQPELVFMFSGQGTQHLNMGANLYRSAPVFRQAIERCTEILQPLLDLDIRNLLYPAAENSAISTKLLNQTRYTQPALFAIEYALMQLWLSWGLTPAAAIGHSIGEIVAACLAGVFSLPDALKLVAARGKLMWDLPSGAMLSVRLGADKIAPRLTPELAIAAINAPYLCVVSGTHDAIAQLQQELEREEIVCKLLQTSHAFHSPMMESIVAPFTELVKNVQLSPPQIPFISLVTADWITDEQAISPNYWADHLLKPVRFAEGVHRLWRHNPNFVLLEVGSRQTLTTLARQQATDRTHQIAIASLGNTSDDNADWQSLLQAVGQLWLAGVAIDWAQFSADEHRYRVPLPTYPFERQKFWIDPPAHQHLAPAIAIDPIPPATSQERIMQTEQLIPTTPVPRTTRLIPEIAAVFKATAGVAIGADEQLATFLELGLDSLSLTQVALSLKKKFKVKVTFRQLLEDCSTLDALAHSIDRQMPPDAVPTPVVSIPIPAVNPTSIAAPSPILPAVSVVNAVAASAIAAPVADSAIASLVQQQLQIMARQLELLGGNNIAPPAPTPIVQIPVAPPAELEATYHLNGRSTTANPILPAVEKPITAPAPGTKIGRSLDTSLTPAQQIALTQISDRYIARTTESKRQAQAHRRYLADPRTVSGFTPLLKEMVYPIVINRAQGSRLWDEDGHEYIDLTNGFGLNFFGWSPDFVTEALRTQLDLGMAIGPQTPLAGKVAKTIAEITGMERVAFCNTGSEAVMAAFRIARTVTGRDRIVIFANSYHGTFDEVLVRAGSDGSVPAAPGIMPNVCDNVLVLDYGTPASLEIIRNCADELAAVIVEPIQSRHPELQPLAFLQELREITTASETALIFDEVVTGFRVAPGGAQEYFGIKADIATYGKVVGGGLPIGILTGSATYMDALDGGFWQFSDRSIPEVGVTFFAGTFVRHPLALAAVEAVLSKLQAGGAQIQISLANKVKRLVEQLREHCQLVGAPIQIEYFSSWFYITFPPTARYGSLLFYLLRIQGIHVWEYRPCFLTLAHSDEDIERIMWAFKVSIAELQSTGLLASAGNAIAINSNLPPQPDAKLGKDRAGNPAWFINDPQRTGKYLQLDKSPD